MLPVAVAKRTGLLAVRVRIAAEGDVLNWANSLSVEFWMAVLRPVMSEVVVSPVTAVYCTVLELMVKDDTPPTETAVQVMV